MKTDRTVSLDIDGSRQRLRLCASHPGLPPLLVVQGGPGLPLLHEVTKYQRRLNLEQDFLVAYWEQRGAGAASAADARTAGVTRHVEDLRFVLRWLQAEAGQPVLLLGISMGGTLALMAADAERDRVRAIIAVSPDLQTTSADAFADAFIREHGVRLRGGVAKVAKMGRPPYLDVGAFQRRARLLADLGTIERGQTFGSLLREMLFALIRTYGPVGAVKALRNVNIVLGKFLPETAPLDLMTNPPRVLVPVHYLFGELDVLARGPLIEQLSAIAAASNSTVAVVPDAGHMVHFDQPDVVRSIAMRV